MAQVEIENVFLITSFSVLEDQTMDMLLGLDMLKRHQVNSFFFFLLILFYENTYAVILINFSVQLIYKEMFCVSVQPERKRHFCPKMNYHITVN